VENTQFKIKDFYAAAYLVLKQCPLVNHYRENGATTFIFENSEKLMQLIEDFNSLQGYCDALSYSACVRNLKTLIYSGRSAQSTSQRGDSNNEFYNNHNNR